MFRICLTVVFIVHDRSIKYTYIYWTMNGLSNNLHFHNTISKIINYRRRMISHGSNDHCLWTNWQETTFHRRNCTHHLKKQSSKKFDVNIKSYIYYLKNEILEPGYLYQCHQFFSIFDPLLPPRRLILPLIS